MILPGRWLLPITFIIIIIVIFLNHAFLSSSLVVVLAYTELKDIDNNIINSHGIMIIIHPISDNNNNILGNLAKQFEYTLDLDAKQIFPNDTIKNSIVT